MQDYTLVTRHTVLARDLNVHSKLYGGIILGWLDEAGYIFAVRECKCTNLVTVAMNNVVFESPANLGDIIEIYARLIKIGNSSITLKILAKNFSVCEGCKNRKIIECEIVFVKVDCEGKPQLINL